MKEELVELTPIGLTRGTVLNEAYFVVLGEKGGKHVISLLVNHDDFQALYTAINDKKYPHFLMMNKLAGCLHIRLQKVLLYPSASMSGAILHFSNKENNQIHKVSSNIAGGIIAALSNNSPIFVKQSLFDEIIGNQTHEDGQVTLSVQTMCSKLLEETLKSAVAEENFELASVIRDEIKFRKAFGIEEDDGF